MRAHRHIRTLAGVALGTTLALAGCESPAQPPFVDLAEPARAGMGPVTASAHGGGHLAVGALDVQFAFTAVRKGLDGGATGNARHSVVLGGELVEFTTDVTCMTLDAATGRAWIGGIISRNRSTHPSFTEDRHQVGRDIWFRVVDYGEGSSAEQADRSTFVGFEGDAGIATSADYCEQMPWPDDDARTNPVSEGNIQVKARTAVG